jgi:hypothetical protein
MYGDNYDILLEWLQKVEHILWNRVILEKPLVPRVIKDFLLFAETES